MIGRKWLKSTGIVTLCLFVFFIFSADIGLAQQEEDALAKAKKLYQEGDYEGSIDLLSKFIEKLKAMVAQKKNVAEAFYLLAKIYFEVGDDTKVEENLEKVFNTYPAFKKDETNFSFKERVEKIKKTALAKKGKKKKAPPKEMKPVVKKQPQDQPRVIEQPQPKKKKKKFPTLLVVGGIVVVAVLAMLLLKKKKKEDEYDIRGDWTVNFNVAGNAGFFYMTFSGSKTSGSFVDNEGDTGTYSVNGSAVNFGYNNYNISFSGNFGSQGSMSGSLQVEGTNGSWNATRGFTGVLTTSLSGLKAKAGK